MNYKKKIKAEEIIYGLLSMVGFGCVGGSFGYFLGTVQNSLDGKMNGFLLGLVAILSLAGIFVLYTINMCLHEIGHMIFGLLTGYKFNSLRFGKLMLCKENGKLQFRKYNMPGTGGQCIMTAPDTAIDEMPVVLYNIGGLIVNLTVFIAGIILFLKLKSISPVAGMICLVFSMTSLIILITNGLPFSQIGTDGANTIILYKNKDARKSFRNQLEVIKYLADDYSVQEMPEELFEYDKAVSLDNPLITAQAFNRYNYLSANKMYDEAKDLALFILENAKSINQLHAKVLHSELLFNSMVIEKDTESAKKIFKEHKKELMSAAGFISIQRTLYTYYSMVEVDEKKAEKYAKQFEASLKNYPYPKDAAFEKEQFDMAKEVIRAECFYEYCPRCDANLTLQKGYSNKLPYWVCKGCGETLVNPEVPGEIVWLCDKCESMLNIQDGFTEEGDYWTCTECGYQNKIDKSEIYLSNDELAAGKKSPYKGLSDEDVLKLCLYNDEYSINDEENIVVVRNTVDNKLYVKKILGIYDVTVYRYLMEHPVNHMPRIVGVYEGDNNLIVIEEYIEGNTLFELLKEGVLDPMKATDIGKRICHIVKDLHTLENPIIHRDIKPSNIIIYGDEVYLLDVNAAKWYKEDEIEDTKLLGTQYYAAPEQLGYGFSASTEKADIYAIGVLLNVMVTGKLPKEEKAPDVIWNVVKRCICLEADERYTDDELITALEGILR